MQDDQNPGMAAVAEASAGFSLREFEIFRAYLEAGTASGAAGALGLSQPAISRGLTSLEGRLGYDLFERQGKRLLPRPEAMALLGELEPVFAALSRISAGRAVQPVAHSGLLQIAAPPTIAHRLMPDWLSEYARMHPDLEIRMDCLNGEGLAGAVADGQFDLAVASTDPVNSAVRTEVLHESYSVCALPRDHPLTAKKVIHVADLHDVPFITQTRRHSSRSKIDQIFEKAKVRLNIRLETATGLSALEFVRNGVGVALITLDLINATEFEGVAFRPFHPEVMSRLMVYLPRRTVPRACVRDLITLMEQRMAEVGARTRLG
ncbi:LysR family transcriptional regulator [Pseudooceanicola sp. GBMRC 2024]|uniref:LysR family transcriptional regulator n=1 Tax=Pseudooceanicola albus TaxID=2692189 RepID=A0A6L7G2P9_9RHOB|nr:LysR substrate-binding domain-containing protein [Pseudooceanicola albus]MXN17962.1 LysR family transcriptional regulator [Pseudooceanicola albus]